MIRLLRFIPVLLFVLPFSLRAEKDTTFFLGQPRITKALPSRYETGVRFGVRFLDVEQGLPSSYIMGAAQDSLGRMWFSTDGGGICVYDGDVFQLYGTEEGIPLTSGNVFFFDSRGDLWYGNSNRGIIRIHGNSVTHFRHDSLTNHNLAFIREDQKGTLFIGSGNQVYRIEKDVLVQQKTNAVRAGAGLRDLRFLDKHIYLAAGDSLYIFDKEWNFLALHAVPVQKIIPVEGDHVQLVTRDALIDFNNGKQKILISDLRTGIDMISDGVYDARSKTTMLASWGRGVILHSEKGTLFFDRRFGMRSDRLYTIFIDNKQRIWYCTDGGGVQVLTAPSIENYSESAGLSVPYIMEIAEVDQELWVGTRGGGMFRRTKNADVPFEKFSEQSGLKSDYVYAIHQTASGEVWIGTHRDGLFIRRNGKFTRHDTKSGFYSNTVWGIESDASGKVYLATFAGLVVWDGVSFNLYTTDQGLPGNRIYSIAIDKKGEVWLGTSAGLACYHRDGKIDAYTRSDGLPDDIVWDIEPAADGLWLATHGGICRFENGVFTVWNVSHGLSTNMVWALKWSNDQLWAGTEKGVQCFSLVQSQLQLSRTLGFADGFTGNDVTPASIYLQKNGKILFGTSRQLVEYDPAYDNTGKEPALQPLLLGLELFYRTYDFTSSRDSVPVFGSLPKGMVFAHDQNTITLSYLSVDVLSSGALSYRIELEQDNEKISSQISNQQKVTFTNLAPGNYKISISASSDGEVWSEPAQWSFSIQPPFWQTWWFRILFLLVAGGMVWLFILFRTRALRKSQKRLEGLVKERTAEITLKNDMLEEKNKEILDSMTYARRIQNALFASDELLSRSLNEFFLFYRPREAVSGDFYWASKVVDNNEERFLICVADCTGHGVPGAFMSLISIAFLNEAIRERKITSPGSVLNHVREDIIRALDQEGKNESRDGMDAVLLSFSKDLRNVRFALSNNPLWIIRRGELIEIKPDKMPVGPHLGVMKDFTQHEMQLESGDQLFLFTDGYADQFGGPKGKKFKYAQFSELLKRIATLPAEQQKSELEHALSNWKSGLEQNDDILVIGIRV